jgi:uncharacterized membrane protein YeaQ/YmgE (transglycosylase-associated protein family)
MVTEYLFAAALNLARHIRVPQSSSRIVTALGSRDSKMHISPDALIITLFVGLVAGWLAGQIVQGTGFGLIGDLVVGVLGAIFGAWLLPQLGIMLGGGLVGAIINATIGALILLLIVRVVRGSGRLGSWRGR